MCVYLSLFLALYLSLFETDWPFVVINSHLICFLWLSPGPFATVRGYVCKTIIPQLNSLHFTERERERSRERERCIERDSQWWRREEKERSRASEASLHINEAPRPPLGKCRTNHLSGSMWQACCNIVTPRQMTTSATTHRRRRCGCCCGCCCRLAFF